MNYIYKEVMMKHRNKTIVRVTLFCFAALFPATTLFYGCSKKQEPEKPFLEFANDLFLDQVTTDTISLHYTLSEPENFGIQPFEPTLGDYGAEQMKEDIAASERYLETLKSYDYTALTEEEKLIYDSLKPSLESDLAMKDYIYLQESLGPTTGLQAQLPILLAEYAFNEKQDIDDYIGILEDLKRYFNQIATFEQEKSKRGYFMSDETVDAIIEQCNAFISNPEQNLLINCFVEKINAMDDLTLDEKTLYEERNRDAVLNSVIPAYQLLIDTLTSLKGTGKDTQGLCGYDGGKEYYELLAQAQTGSSKTVKEMKKSLNAEYLACMTTMATIQTKNPGILDDYENLKFPYTDPTEIMEYLKTAVRNDFPLLEDVNYNVKYVHESLRDYLSPAMYLIPPIDDLNHNNIYINNKPEYDLEQIFPTIAHEGYPGHLYQNVYFRKSNPQPIRSFLSPTGYEEGWATYVESYSYELAKLEDDMAAMLSANTIASHCLYSLTDIGVNYEGWSLEDTVSFWSPLGIGRDAAEEIYLTMAAEPCVYLPYAIGCIEFMELRNEAEDILGDQFTLKAFHTFLMELGPAPFDVVESRMKNNLSNYAQ